MFTQLQVHRVASPITTYSLDNLKQLHMLQQSHRLHCSNCNSKLWSVVSAELVWGQCPSFNASLVRDKRVHVNRPHPAVQVREWGTHTVSSLLSSENHSTTWLSQRTQLQIVHHTLCLSHSQLLYLVITLGTAGVHLFYSANVCECWINI